MTSKFGIFILAIVLSAAGTTAYWFRAWEPQVASPAPPSVDDLTKRSAHELANPTTMELTTAQKEAVNREEVAGRTAKSADAGCVDSGSADFTCYENYYRALVTQQGVAYAFADLKRRYPGSGYVKAQCHPLTHVIGREAANVYGQIGRAYANGDSFCWSGYYHGVMEGVVGKISRRELAGTMNTICADVPGKATYNFDYFNCVHGLGHGVMVITDTKLFDSLKLCDNFSGEWERSSCYGGVFMENVMVDNRNHFTEYLRPDEPLYPCVAVEDRYKTPCYLMQTSYILKVTNGDFEKVFVACRAAEPAFRAICYQSTGRDASGSSVSNVQKTKATCELGTDYEQRSNCVVGAVKDFISYFHSDVQARELCAALPEDVRTVCTTTAESYYKSFEKA